MKKLLLLLSFTIPALCYTSYNSGGVVISSLEKENGSVVFDASGLGKGTYIVCLQNGQGIVQTAKLIVR